MYDWGDCCDVQSKAHTSAGQEGSRAASLALYIPRQAQVTLPSYSLLLINIYDFYQSGKIYS